jgi:hypothetical protein
MYKEAYENAVKALELGPEKDKERLIANLSFCEAKLNDN